eukprot:gnl/TRDRNA2_/TRDRNA2_137268_c1_seq2.p1 gnl/TRDRNA2_/TRDRNA2_137268_c1~~gnl/TRDRNA2_/TRDRNA2_137268_c1_seq2.p1  ORF type:complete len:334 (+),score=48.82 gnl/TRDRNA2_/TRDRNA2_137268_c1_seq2:79-1080(+)
MHCVSFVLLLALDAPCHAEDLLTTPTDNERDVKDEFLNAADDNPRVSSKSMRHRTLKKSNIHPADLEFTMLAKPGHLKAPRCTNLKLLALPSRLNSRDKLGHHVLTLNHGHPACTEQRHGVLQTRMASNKEDGLGEGARKFMKWLGSIPDKVDSMLGEDENEKMVAQIANGEDSWELELDLYLREPTSPLNKEEARRLERVSLSLQCLFAQKDEGVYPSRGATTVMGSRFFAEDRGYWIADEPGYFKFTLNIESPVVSSGLTMLPPGKVFFNAKMEEDSRIDVQRPEGAPPRLVSGVATVKRDVPARFLAADYTGILAEYIVVGTFEGRIVKK